MTTNLKPPIKLNPDKDKKGPFVLGAAGTVSGKSRIVVTGSSSWVSNSALSYPTANRDLAMNMINWLTADESLISIPTKEPEDRRIMLSGRQMNMIALSSVIFLPLIVVLFRIRRLVEAEVAPVKPNGLLVAVLVLAALTGGIYWTNKHKADEAKKPAATTEATPKVIAIPEDQVKEIRIAKKDAEPTVVSKAGDKWILVQPKAMAADQEAVGSMVTALSSLNADRVVEEKPADLAPFGLATPKEQVTVTKKDGKTVTLDLGDDSPVGSGVFAKLAGDSKVYVIPTYTKSNFDKTEKDLRDKRLLTFNSDKLTSLQLTGQGPDCRVRQKCAERLDDRQTEAAAGRRQPD